MARSLPPAPPAPAGSLAEALSGVPDPRRPRGWRPDYAPVPLVGLLQATVAAVLCGARSQNAVAQWIRERGEDAPALLESLGIPPGRGACAATLYRVYRALDVVAFEAALGTWLAQTGVAPDDPVALDGKTLRGVRGPWEAAPGGERGERGERGEYVPGLHLVAAYTHRAQAVLAQVRTGGKGQELAAVGEALAQVLLEGRLVTGDALLAQREVCTQIVAAGGDYLFPIKANQPTLHADLAAAFSPVDPQRPRRAGDAAASSLV